MQGRRNADQVLDELTSEFQDIPVRIVLTIFQSYLTELREVSTAARATRERILDACLVA